MVQTKIDPSSLQSYLPLAEALASPTRLRILALLGERPQHIAELAAALGMRSPSVVPHIQQLEAAGIIETAERRGRRGVQKVCALRMARVTIPLRPLPGPECYQVAVPVGQYVDWAVQPTCGLAGPDGPIGSFDEPRYFADPARVQAGMLWFTSGHLTYRFPNYLLPSQQPTAIEFVMEIASEAPGYNLDWPSDITFAVNELPAGGWTCPGDFGGRRGAYTPAWVSEQMNQYGLYKALRIDARGTLIDGIPIAPLTLADLHLARRTDITLRLSVSPTARHIGGLTLFGNGFGNYGQDLQMRLYYEAVEDNRT